MKSANKKPVEAAAVAKEKKSVYSDYTPTQLRTQLRKAQGVAGRQEQMARAGAAMERLHTNPDFQEVLTYLRTTVAQLTLDAPQRNSEARQNDAFVAQSVAVALDMFEALPEVGEKMGKQAVETKQAITTIQAHL